MKMKSIYNIFFRPTCKECCICSIVGFSLFRKTFDRTKYLLLIMIALDLLHCKKLEILRTILARFLALFRIRIKHK